MLKQAAVYVMAIFTLCAAVLPGQGMAELHKIPMLIGHYQHHQHEHDGEQLSITEFLWMHYSESSSHKTEESHEDLPLFHQCCTASLFIAEELYVFVAPAYNVRPTHPEQLCDTYFHQPYTTIFQPPRFS